MPGGAAGTTVGGDGGTCPEKSGQCYDRDIVDDKCAPRRRSSRSSEGKVSDMNGQGSERDPTIENVLGPLAAAIMRAVWAEGESTVASVSARLGEQRAHAPAYTTVMTVMGRLYERGLLSRKKVGRQYVYAAAAREEATIDRLSRAAVDALISRFGTTAYRQFALRLADVDPVAREKLAELAASHEEA